MNRLSKFLNTPLAIGGKTISGRLVLAPLSGLTHAAFRELIALYGGYGLLYTGMASAKALPNENPRVSAVFSWRTEELPTTVCQIFGSDPDAMARAAARVEEEGFFGVDINCGCSASAICKQGAGAALLADPGKAARVVRAVRKAVNIPVLVKYRTGWKDDPANAAELARLFCGEGADALVFHPRVAPDLRTRPPKWEYIGLVKEAAAVPVFGNGNVFSEEDCRNMIEKTGCDGVALGRMALAKPWIMAQWTGKHSHAPQDYWESAQAMARLCAKHFEPRMAYLRFRQFVPYFCANFKFGHALAKQINAAGDIPGAIKALEAFLASPPEINSRPNPHLFS